MSKQFNLFPEELVDSSNITPSSLVIQKTSDVLSKELWDNPEAPKVPKPYPPRQLVFSFSSEEQNHNKECESIFANIPNDLAFIEKYDKNDIDLIVEISFLSEEQKQELVKFFDQGLLIMKDMSDRADKAPWSKAMFFETIGSLKRMKYCLQTNKEFLSKHDYLVNAYNKDFYSNKGGETSDEKKVENFLFQCRNKKESLANIPTQQISNDLKISIKDLLTLGYSIHDTNNKEQMNPEDPQVLELLDIWWGNNNLWDTETAAEANNILNNYGTINSETIKKFLERFIVLEYVLAHTDYTFEKEIDITQYQLQTIRESVTKNGYAIVIFNGLMWVEEKKWWFNGLIQWAKKLINSNSVSVEEYNKQFTDLYYKIERLENILRNIEDTKRKLSSNTRQTIEKIPAFHQYLEKIRI